MQITETTTARGSGFWGYDTYEIELKTRSTVYTDSAGASSRTVSVHLLGFRCSAHYDFRSFASDRERSEFINKNFTELKVREIPQTEQESTPLPCRFADVVGEYLSDVTFVMDYLQLRFCGPSFSFYNWPEVILANRKLATGEPGYRDALCSLIDKVVQSVDEYLDTGLTFTFETGETMMVSLRIPVGSSVPEVAEYSSGKNSGWIWSGEQPFD